MEACVILGHTKLQPVKQEAPPFKGGEKSPSQSRNVGIRGFSGSFSWAAEFLPDVV